MKVRLLLVHLLRYNRLLEDLTDKTYSDYVIVFFDIKISYSLFQITIIIRP